MSETIELVRKKSPTGSGQHGRMTRTIPKSRLLEQALKNPLAVQRELNNRSLYQFLQYFWTLVSPHEFQPNWHIEYLCNELEQVANRVADKMPREYDLIINVPPGTTKTITCSIMFPAWCWSKWYWMRFITASYSASLSMESADYCRDLVKSVEFQQLYPEISVKEDKDTKSNFKIVKRKEVDGRIRTLVGGGRFSTSVGAATLTGFHGDILIIDDPLNPTQAASEKELASANHWCEQTLSSRKTNKAVTPTIYIMQRLHQDDPAGHILSKQKENIRHICLPGEIRNYKKFVKPKELISRYVDDLLDPNRLSWDVLKDMESDFGQYGYAGQIGQNPTPPGGAMFKVDMFGKTPTPIPKNHIVATVRYWDKAATSKGAGARTAGVRMSKLDNGRFYIDDVRKGRWETHVREEIILQTAEIDGPNVVVWIEQEPGSGGKESAEGTIRSLAGFKVFKERPTGDKTDRADSYSVQVNNGNVILLAADWNHDFVEEYRYFPHGTHKDQVDAGSGAFNKLVSKRFARGISRGKR